MTEPRVLVLELLPTTAAVPVEVPPEGIAWGCLSAVGVVLDKLSGSLRPLHQAHRVDLR